MAVWTVTKWDASSSSVSVTNGSATLTFVIDKKDSILLTHQDLFLNYLKQKVAVYEKQQPLPQPPKGFDPSMFTAKTFVPE